MDPHSLNLPESWLPQVIVCNRPEYVISYAQRGPCTFVHCAMYKWGLKVLDKLYADVKIAFKLHGGPVYAIATTEKQKRFDAYFGFKPTGNHTADGEVLIKEE